MLYELRIYRCTPGRLPDLHKRFQTVTQDMAERERKWGAFQADPEWLARRAESERSGPIIANITSAFLAPTAYSRLK